MGHFKDLKAYQHARRLAVMSQPLVERLPAREQALADQWRRACQSVMLNLAEGASRRGAREFRRYADVARGSLHEIEAILDMVTALGYLPASELAVVAATRDECAKTVYGLIRKLSAAAESP